VKQLHLGNGAAGVSASLPAHPERRSRYRGIASAECLEQTGVEFSKGSNEGGAKSMSRRFGRTTSTKSKGGAYGKGVGLGISVLLALIVISLAVWLLRRSARDESTSATPEAGEGVEAGVEEAVVAPDTPSAEDVLPREEPPPGEERPERRGETPTSPPTPREEPPPGEERPGRR
jgi:hypothetical protein